MKKIILPVIVVIAIFLGSCDLSTKYNVTVENGCPFRIDVYVQLSSSEPSAYITLETSGSNSRHVFNISNAINSIHIRDADNPSNLARKDVLQMYASKNDTWTIKWDNIYSKYYLLP